MSTVADSPVLTLTPAATAHVRRALANDGLHGHGLRISVVTGGCSGNEYALDFAPAPREGDVVFLFDDLQVFVDAASREKLAGTVLDYVDSLSGGARFRTRTRRTNVVAELPSLPSDPHSCLPPLASRRSDAASEHRGLAVGYRFATSPARPISEALCRTRPVSLLVITSAPQRLWPATLRAHTTEWTSLRCRRRAGRRFEGRPRRDPAGGRGGGGRKRTRSFGAEACAEQRSPRRWRCPASRV
jgi:iron-sulfur cluster assembly protein